MSQKVGKNNNRVYRLILTGGPCGGKTTGQARLCTFFENLGWKVFRVPETASVLMGGGVKWSDLSDEEDLKPEQWERMKAQNSWNNVELRDNRYNQVIHMVSAAKGAEAFYRTEDHAIRYEGVELARQLDDYVAQAWVGHPYYDVIDNSTDFENKVIRMVGAVCNRLGINAGDRLSSDSRKRKFLVRCLPDELSYPQFQDFIVVHDYLVTPEMKMQARIRRRGQNVRWDSARGRWDLETGNWTYTHTIRRPEINKERVELKMQISSREYDILRAQRDSKHYTIYKKRRCFLWHNQYFQMDIYQEPCHPRCRGLIILETYTTQKGEDLNLPEFLEIEKEVTSDPQYSMYNLSMTEEAFLARSTTKGESIPAIGCLLENSESKCKQAKLQDEADSMIPNGDS